MSALMMASSTMTQRVMFSQLGKVRRQIVDNPIPVTIPTRAASNWNANNMIDAYKRDHGRRYPAFAPRSRSATTTWRIRFAAGRRNKAHNFQGQDKQRMQSCQAQRRQRTSQSLSAQDQGQPQGQWGCRQLSSRICNSN